jgi:hypothetical protein
VSNITRQQLFLALLAALIGCGAPRVESLAARVKPARYRVLAMSLGQGVTIQSEYEIELRPLRPDARIIQTNYSAGVVDKDGEKLHFDSRHPSKGDPWPMLIQHVVVSTPMRVVFDDSGKPVEVEEVDAWRTHVLERLNGLELPAKAHNSNSALLEPSTILRDLHRTFPGAPAADGTVRREVTVAGIQGWVVDRCRQARSPRGLDWRCEGGAESLEEGSKRVFGVVTHLLMRYDRTGLYYLEADYVGTLVAYDPSSGELVDRPVGGKRSVERL